MEPSKPSERPRQSPKRTYPEAGFIVFLVIVVAAAVVDSGVAAVVFPLAVIISLFTWRMGVLGFFAGLAVSALVFGVCTAIVLNSIEL